MAIRTVRLDEETEQALAEIRRRTGANVSRALKQGLLALRERVRREDQPTFGEVYRTLDLGAGGYSKGSARDAKALVRAAIAAKHRR